MAIDPSIALAVRPVDITAQYATPFQTIGQALSLQNMMRQGQLQSLELHQQQAMWQERQALAQLLSGGQAYQQPPAQTAPSVVTPGGTTAAPLPALTGQTPAVSAGPALVAQPPTVAPLAGGAAPTMADLMNLPTVDRGSQMAALAGMPQAATQPADAQTQNLGWPTQQETPAAPDTSQPSAPAAPAAAAPAAPTSARPTGAIQNAPALPIPDFQAMIKATPISGLGMQMAENYNKYLKAHYDTLNAQLTNQQNTGKRVAQLAGSIVDEPTKMSAIGQAMAENLISQDEARRLMTVSPTDKIWQSWENQGKTASEVAADNLAQSKFHLEQVEKAFAFAKAPYEIATARANAEKAGIDLNQAQRVNDAAKLAAAAARGQDAVNQVKATMSPERLAPFEGAVTPQDFFARGSPEPGKTIPYPTAVANQQTDQEMAKTSARLAAENQILGPAVQSINDGKTKLQDYPADVQSKLVPLLAQSGYTGLGKRISDEQLSQVNAYNNALDMLRSTKAMLQDENNRSYLGWATPALQYVPGVRNQINRIQGDLSLTEQKLKNFISNKSLRGLNAETLERTFPSIGLTPGVNDYRVNQLITAVENERDQYLKDMQAAGKVLPEGGAPPTSKPSALAPAKAAGATAPIPGKVHIRTPDGSEGWIDADKLPTAIQRGAQQIQ